HYDDPYLYPSSSPATPQHYTLSLHDALPIYDAEGVDVRLRPELGAAPLLRRHVRRRPEDDARPRLLRVGVVHLRDAGVHVAGAGDRKSTRLNSSHRTISYAVFCLKKKTTSRA